MVKPARCSYSLHLREYYNKIVNSKVMASSKVMDNNNKVMGSNNKVMDNRVMDNNQAMVSSQAMGNRVMDNNQVTVNKDMGNSLDIANKAMVNRDTHLNSMVTSSNTEENDFCI